LAYICDVRDSLLEQNRRQYPATVVTSDLAQVLADDTVDAVLVAVPADKHHAVAKQVLEAGKHAYVEKPLALEVGHAEELRGLAETGDRVLMVGHLLLYHPAVLHIRRLIDAGELGEVQYVYSQRLNLGIVRQAENAWWSLAPHDISVAQYLLGGAPESVSATGQCFLQPKLGVEDVVFATVQFDNGTFAHHHCSWLDPHKVRRITVVGTKKMAVFDDMEPTEKVRVYDKGADVEPGYVDYADAVRIRTGDVVSPALDRVEPLRAEIDHFLAAIQGAHPARSDGRNGCDVVRVLVAGQESLAANGAVRPVEPGA
jgi:predicted dehydrogenase